MEPTQDRPIEETIPVGKTAVWKPAATQQAQRLLAAIGRRRSFGRARLRRVSSWLGQRAVRIGPMSGFQPLNLQWYRPEWPTLSSHPTGKNLWRHEYVVRTITVHQNSSRRDGVPASPRGKGSSSGDGTLALPLASGRGMPERISHPTTYSSGLQIQSGQAIARIVHAENWLTGQPGERPVLILAASSQPRREVSPSQYRTGKQEQASAHDLVSDEPGPLVRRSEASNTVAPNSRKADSPAYDTSNLVNELFDRAMHSHPIPRLDLQLLPQRTVAGPVSETSERGRPERRTSDVAAWPAHAEPVSPAGPPSIQFSRNDVNRVADKVALVLKQRERFERERKGGLS